MPQPAARDPWWRRIEDVVAAAAPRARDWPVWTSIATALAIFVATALGAAAYFRHRPAGMSVRFTLAPPEQSSCLATPAISPDGQHLSFRRSVQAAGERFGCAPSTRRS